MKSLKQLILFAFLCFFFVSSYGQNIFKAMLKDVESKAALIDATVQGSRFGFDSFSDMLARNNEIRSYFDDQDDFIYSVINYHVSKPLL